MDNTLHARTRGPLTRPAWTTHHREKVYEAILAAMQATDREVATNKINEAVALMFLATTADEPVVRNQYCEHGITAGFCLKCDGDDQEGQA
jgi:hypothetical protein